MDYKIGQLAGQLQYNNTILVDTKRTQTHRYTHHITHNVLNTYCTWQQKILHSVGSG